MKKAFLFPGQGAQFPGMGKDLYDAFPQIRKQFDLANERLGFSISSIMFGDNAEALIQTRVTQPALFLHATLTMQARLANSLPDAVAGHSLGEFSALVASRCISFEDGLDLVYQRALAMQIACENHPGTMAAVVGLDDELVETVCSEVTTGVVVPANYNCPGQLVISGSIDAVKEAMETLRTKDGAKVIPLSVGGAFHSPLMSPAADMLAKAIERIDFQVPLCPIYQNVTALAETEPVRIKENLLRQLTAPVRFTQSLRQMIADGISSFVEVGGNGKVLQGLVRKVDRQVEISAL